MKNVLIIQGEGRPKGNTAQLVECFVKVRRGCNACRYGNTNGKLQIDTRDHLREAYEFGRNIY